MIPLTPKEVVIRIARHVLGESRVHDYLIKRGIGLRQLGNGYYDNDASENSVTENCAAPIKQQLIFMADGKWMHGGLTDRLRGMASAYRFATEHNLDFKIFHNSPFLLQEVLMPNKVDWTIDEKQISRNSSIAKPVLLYREDFNNDSALERQLDDKHVQFHLYSCVDTLGEKFPEYFNELFKPSPLLEEQLRHYKFQLGTNYSSYSFRFQNKLGDFKEFKFKALSAKKKCGFVMSPPAFVLAGENPFLQSWRKGHFVKGITQLDLADCTWDAEATVLAGGNAEIKELISILRCQNFSGYMTLGGGAVYVNDLMETRDNFVCLIQEM